MKRDKLGKFVKGNAFSQKLKKKMSESTKKFHKSYPFRSGFQEGKKNYGWKGGKTKNYEYILVQCKKHPRVDQYGYVREHTLVMENKVSRYLRLKEVVHHINGIKHDNRPENLYLFPSFSKHNNYERNLATTYKRWIAEEINNI